MSLKHVLSALLMLGLAACDEAPASSAGASRAAPPTSAASSVSGARAYVCPEVGASTLDWTPGAEDTLASSLKLPEGFAYQAPPEAPGTAEFLKPFKLAGPTSDSADSARTYRIFVTQTALGVDIRDKAKHPAYKMGTGFGEDGDRGIQTNLFVGDFEIDGRSVHVNRQPGDSGAVFEATFEEGGKFYIYGFAVAIHDALGAPDLDAARCVADFDRIGLGLLKSMKLIKK